MDVVSGSAIEVVFDMTDITTKLDSIIYMQIVICLIILIILVYYFFHNMFNVKGD